MTSWAGMSAADLGRRIAAGDLDPRDLTEALLTAIRTHDLRDRIYARLTEERAHAEAEAAAQRAGRGQRLGPLDGVPVSWKDNFDSAGIATEAGSALLKGRVPDRDAEVLRCATAAGLVCLGKTHLSELAFSGLGLNPVTATAPNVNDPAAVPGGSSSGAAASVAFGLAAAAIGTDTGGSVRIPAAWQDLVGLKTTIGRLSCRGVVPLVESFDTVGPLTRTVEDAALMFAALAGGSAPDLRGASLRGRRLLVVDTVAFEDIEERPLKAFEDGLYRLTDAGAVVERTSVEEVSEAMNMAGIVFTPEAYGIWRDRIEAAPDTMFRPILERFRSGAAASGSDCVAAWRRLRGLTGIWARKTAGYDAVVLPTAPLLPPDAERLMYDDDYYVRANLLTLRNTRIGNLFGLCGLTLPTTVPSCGLMLLCPPMQERRLLRLGAAAEAVLR